MSHACTCVVCGKEFQGRRDSKACNGVCKRKHYQNKARAWMAKAREEGRRIQRGASLDRHYGAALPLEECRVGIAGWHNQDWPTAGLSATGGC